MLVKAESAVLKLQEGYEAGLKGIATKVEMPQGEEPLPPGFAFFLFADTAPIATLGAADKLFTQLRAELTTGPVGELFWNSLAGGVQ